MRIELKEVSTYRSRWSSRVGRYAIVIINIGNTDWWNIKSVSCLFLALCYHYEFEQDVVASHGTPASLPVSPHFLLNHPRLPASTRD